MARTLGIFIDLNDFYHRVNMKFHNKVSYQSLLDYFKKIGMIQSVTFYGISTSSNVKPFIHCLKQLGANVKFERARRGFDWAVGMAVDIVNMADSFDTIIIGSSKLSMIPLIEYLTSRGKYVVVISSGIPKDLSDVSNQSFEITSQMLE